MTATMMVVVMMFCACMQAASDGGSSQAAIHQLRVLARPVCRGACAAFETQAWCAHPATTRMLLRPPFCTSYPLLCP